MRMSMTGRRNQYQRLPLVRRVHDLCQFNIHVSMIQYEGRADPRGHNVVLNVA